LSIDKNVTHPDTTSQQGLSADTSIAAETSGASETSGTSSLSEDGDSPPDSFVDPDVEPDTDWISPAQNKVENNFADLRWKALLPSGQPLCIQLLDKFAQVTEISSCTISVLWTNDSEMAGINKQFRQQDKPTNILSFPAQDFLPDIQISNTKASDTQVPEPIFLGDMALGFETVTDGAADNGQPAEHHLAHLFLHGLLHLVGYDHQNEAEAEEMEALEIQLLAEMNIPNPYLLKPDPNKEGNDHV
jgi:probable rRNA maturation factor